MINQEVAKIIFSIEKWSFISMYVFAGLGGASLIYVAILSQQIGPNELMSIKPDDIRLEGMSWLSTMGTLSAGAMFALIFIMMWVGGKTRCPDCRHEIFRHQNSKGHLFPCKKCGCKAHMT